MKTINFRHAVVAFLCAGALIALWACSVDSVEQSVGRLPDKEGLENTYGILRSNNAPTNQVQMLFTTGYPGERTENIYYQITKPAEQALTLEMRVDPALVDAYNEAHQGDESYTKQMLLPEDNYEFVGGKTLSIAQNGKKSEPRQLKFKAEGLSVGEYLLPVTVAASDAEPENEWQTVYYRVRIREPQPSDSELNTDQVFLVGYIDVSLYQPLLANDWYVYKTDQQTTWAQVWYRTVGNIINLSRATLGYEEGTRRAKLNLGSDMTYVLDHAVKYLLPLQESGRKVCISIEGGGSGVGFCNLTDAQIADFVAQVKAVVENYGIDGINLWDRNSGYGQDGTPAMNTTSYPKLIKAMYTMLKALGSDKILSVTDHLQPTEYFWDTAATGGIEVGQYLDYAWSGYRDNTIPFQIVDPWHPNAVDSNGEKIAYEGTHKPFAGMDPAKYGCINMPWYTTGDIGAGRLYEWRKAGCKQSNILVLELRTVLQDQYESTWPGGVIGAYNGMADDGIIDYIEYDWMPGYLWEIKANTYDLATDRLANLNDPQGRKYDKWLKDW